MRPRAALSDGAFYTVDEAAEICMRTKKTIMNLIYRERLPMRKARPPGRRIPTVRKMTLLSEETVRVLRKLTLGF